MTGTSTQTRPASASYWTSDAVHARNRKRYAAERRFRWYGIAALAFATGFLIILFSYHYRHWLDRFHAVPVQA
jgi:hypothetical protein